MRIAFAIALAALPPWIHPWPIGAGAPYHPAAPVRDGRPIAGSVCAVHPIRFDAHIEVFASRRVAILPRGIGRGPSGCWYDASTNAPTGVIRLTGAVTLGDLFRIWGQPLGPQRLLSFRGTTTAFVGGRKWHGDPRRIRLTRHAQVVLEIGGYVAPHPSYVFPKGTP